MSRRVAGEQGSVLVVMAVALPVLLLFVALIIDAGNWFTHKSQLRNRAAASRIAISSAWAVGSRSRSRELPARPSTSSPRATTAPIGTSPAATAARASTRARPIMRSSGVTPSTGRSRAGGRR